MSDKPTLSKVVKRAVAHRLAPKSFNSLISQLETREPILPAEYSTHLLALDTHGASILNKKENDECRVDLVIHLSLSSQEQLAKFWKCLSSVDPLSQIAYLKKLAYILAHKSVVVDGEIISNLIGFHFKEYTISIFTGLSDSSPKQDQLLAHHIIIFWGNLIDRFYTNDSSLEDFMIKLLKCLKRLNYQRLLHFLFKKSEPFLNKEKLNKFMVDDSSSLHKVSVSDRSDQSTNVSPPPTTSFKTLTPAHLSSGYLAGYQEMKQFLWFTNIMKSFRFDDNIAIFSNFVSNFCSGNDQSGNPVNKNSYLTAIEFVQALFKGISHSIQNRESSYVLFNWKNFILSRVPEILQSLKLTSEENAEKVIDVAFQSLTDRIIQSINSISIGSTNPYDLMQAFVKSCIFNKVLPPSSFQKFFPAEFKTAQQSLQQELNQFKTDLDLQKSFNEKLLNVNIEFTSLEESGLVDFIGSLPRMVEFSYQKQLELGKIVKSIVEDLINYQDQEKLNRILLAMLSNVQFVNIIAFNSNPESILTKMIDYADKDCFKLEDDDDERFQDIYSYFGVLLLGITFLAELFEIDYSKLAINNSFTMKYLNDVYYRHGYNLTNSSVTNSDAPNSEDGVVVANFNNLMSDWINALFDDSNDGLSDDLIKSVNIKHIYKLIPMIYQQSIIAARAKVIDMAILSNGIEYLSQVFLVPCTLSIINWLLDKLSFQRSVVDNSFLEVLHSIIKSNLGNEVFEDDEDDLLGEDPEKQASQETPVLIFRIVLNICGSNILHTLRKMRDWRSSKTVTQIIKVVTKQMDPNYIEKHVDVKHDVQVHEGLRKYFCTFVKPEPAGTRSDQEVAELCFVHRYLNHQKNHELLVNYLVDEIANYQRASNDESRLIITLGAFVCVLNSVDSTDDKRNWRKIRQRVQVEQAAPKEAGDGEFALSIVQHYASIFNSEQPDDMGFDIQIKDDDDMLDDDLFNDNPMGTIGTKKSTSQSLAALVDSGRRHASPLAYLDRMRASDVDTGVARGLKVLGECVQDELNGYYI